MSIDDSTCRIVLTPGDFDTDTRSYAVVNDAILSVTDVKDWTSLLADVARPNLLDNLRKIIRETRGKQLFNKLCDYWAICKSQMAKKL